MSTPPEQAPPGPSFTIATAPSKGLAIASLVLSILGIPMNGLPFVSSATKDYGREAS